MILLMSVNPGYGGQAFIPAVLEKVADLRKMIDASGKKIDIEVDGGVDLSNCMQLREAGATVLVAGNAVFSAKDPERTVRELRGEAK